MSLIDDHSASTAKASKETKIAIAVSRYNDTITNALLKSCKAELCRRGVEEKNIEVVHVPGAFELPLACKRFAETKAFDAVVALGSLIKGETPHFEYIALAVSNGIMSVGLDSALPVVFGILTTETLEQALDRTSGGKRGDKGVEAAVTALEMIQLSN